MSLEKTKHKQKLHLTPKEQGLFTLLKKRLCFIRWKSTTLKRDIKLQNN